jgi:16S rRNA (cytosine1402-N4)-methyltransferase
MEFKHYPVMREEAIEGLNIKPDGIYCDCTLGGGGHTRLILEKLSEKGRLISIDRDSAAIENAKRTINDKRLTLVKSNFSDIESVMEEAQVSGLDGILMDLGVSSYQLDNAERGFSYRFDAPLDMRMDETDKLTAYEVVNAYTEEELTKILFEYGEEKFARRISERIVRERQNSPIKTTLQLADIISSAIPAKNRDGGHPAKRSFQAIRIEVNKELEILEKTIEKGVSLLNEDGRIAVITFHSLEDRIVKLAFAHLASPCTCPKDFPICVCGKKPSVRIITKKPVTPSETELSENNRSHSAKLRVAEKLKYSN